MKSNVFVVFTVYEAQILDRTRSSCSNGADVVVDFVCSPRSVKRSLKVLNEVGRYC